MEMHVGKFVRQGVALGVLCSLLTVAPQSASALTFFANSDTGVNSDPKDCLSHRYPEGTPAATVSFLISCTSTGGGDTILVQGATTPYMESIDPGSRPITFLADPKAQEVASFVPKAVIQPPAGSQGFDVDGVSIVIEGFVIDGSVAGNQAGINLANSHSSTVRGNVIHDATKAIQVSDSDNSLIENNIVYDSEVGINQIAGVSGAINNNLAYGHSEQCILVETNTGSSHKITTNTVHECQTGIRVDKETGQPDNVGTVDVINNIVSSTVGSGIRIADGADIWENFNFIFDFGSVSIQLDVVNTENGAANPGTNSVAGLNPFFVDVTAGIFYLSKILAGQSVDSELFDRGAVDRAGSPINVTGGTTTDQVVDGFFGDDIDPGFHYQGIAASHEGLELDSATVRVKEKNGSGHSVSYTIKGTLPTEDIDPLTQLIVVEVDGITTIDLNGVVASNIFPVGSCTETNTMWRCSKSKPGATNITIHKTKGTFTLKILDIPISAPSATAPLLSNLRLRIFFGSNATNQAEIYYNNGTRMFK